MAKQRVLVVEDDRHFAGQLVDLFQFQGYEVERVETGPQAVEACASSAFDVVILDLVIPGLGGVDVARALRRKTETESVPIIMMSAVYRDPRMFERELRQLNIAEFLPKPFSPIDLGRKVDALLDDSLQLGDAGAKVTPTGSWRLEELQAALGEGPTQLIGTIEFDRRRLLDIFIDIFRRHAAGRLVLTNQQATREIYFLNGYPVAAESGEEIDSLESVLLSLKLLRPAELSEIQGKVRPGGPTFRELVLAGGLVQERQLRRAERTRVRQIVVGSFRWSGGTSCFDGGADFVDRVAVAEVNPVSCLSEAVGRYLGVNELAPDIHPRAHQVVQPGPRFRRLVSYLSLPEELEGLLDQLDGGRTVGDIFKKFGNAQDQLIRSLWLMFSLGIAEAGPAPDVPSSPPADAGQPVEPSAEAGGQFPSGGDATGAPPDLSWVAREHKERLSLDYYLFLGLERHALPSQIDEAGRTLGERYGHESEDHQTDRMLRELRARLQVACKTLSKPSDRHQYDQRLAVLDTGEWTWPIGNPE
ncbi:MAG: response regulator [Myxococcota bacterium]|nr:response regulator [Myxococcota bacterium]